MRFKIHLFTALFVSCCLLWGLMAMTGGLWAAEETRIVDFTMFLRNGKVIRLDSRERRLNLERSAFDIVVYEKKGQSFQRVRTIEWPEITRTIYSVDLINAQRAFYSKAKLLLTRQDDTQTVIEYGTLFDKEGEPVNDFYYSEYNRIAGRWTRTSIPVSVVKKLVLGSKRLMINPKTGTLYPPDYRYDPYSGAPLADSGLKED